MSIESMAIVLHHSRAKGSAKIVLLGIANHDGDGGSYPSVLTLARYANFEGHDAEPEDDSKAARQAAEAKRKSAQKSARTAIRQLESLGEIEVIANAGGSRAVPEHVRPNLYRILISCPPECDRSAQHRTRTADPRVSTGGAGAQGRTPRAPKGDEPSSNHPPTGNSVPTPRESREDDRESVSDQGAGDYALWSPGQKIAEAARRAAEAEAGHAPIKRPDYSRPTGTRSTVPPAPVVPRFDPAAVPPAPPPRSAEDNAAVLALHRTECSVTSGSRGARHLIPATSTICIRCGTDARTLTREDTP